MSQVLNKFLSDNGVSTAKIVDDAVTNAKIADNAVDSLQINALAVTSAKLAADSVITAKILDQNVTGAKIALLGVDTAQLADNAVTAAKIATGAVTNDELNASAITGQTAETVADNADLVLIYDDSGTSLKKMTRANFLTGVGAPDFESETYSLSAGNITAGYIDGGFACIAGSCSFSVKGGGSMIEGASYDFTVAPTGGVAGVVRVTWLNDLATSGAAELVAGDVINIRYVKA